MSVIQQINGDIKNGNVISRPRPLSQTALCDFRIEIRSLRSLGENNSSFGSLLHNFRRGTYQQHGSAHEENESVYSSHIIAFCRRMSIQVQQEYREIGFSPDFSGDT